jgi:predicted secreted protein
MISRRMTILACAAGAVGLMACAPIPQVIDTPKTGDAVALSVKQPLQVRWVNSTPAAGAWVLEKDPAAASVALVKRTAQPPSGGAMGLDIFDLVGAKPGAERLTFTYQRKNGQAPDAYERVTIKVTVS